MAEECDVTGPPAAAAASVEQINLYSAQRSPRRDRSH